MKIVSEQVLTPYTDVEVASERDRVTLSCNYTASVNTLQWHYPNQDPQFILYKGARSRSSEHIPDKRYTSTTSWTSTELVITSLTLADTALYYFALGDYTQ
uniref:Ig-like domain-containing protein n=1 Tax=Oncorhynchus kisutch TaxID=8019 RepID=A0A8C7HMC0_ONCKI